MTNKFSKIYEDLVSQIERGTLIAGRLLPSEHELTVAYDTSRETIRKALNLLSEKGYIHKIKGKGSIILDTKKVDFSISGICSFKELAQKLGQSAQTYVKVLREGDSSPFLREQLNLHKQDKVWEVIRVRAMRHEKIILDKDFFVKEIIPGLTEVICQNSIYEYIEKNLGLSVSFAKKEITVEELTKEDREYLDMKEYQNVVVVKKYVYLDDARLFQYSESRHRPDKFRFVDFTRRYH